MIKIKKYQIEDYISDSAQSSLNLKADLVGGKVPANQLPSYVDDVIEVNNYVALPNPGATGVIYITIDNNKVYRWSGTAYIEILSGSTNLSYIPGASNGTVNSDTGNDAVIPLADTLNAGLFSATEKSKLASIATGAEVNVNADWNAVSGDSQILNKPTIPSISGLATVTYVDAQDALKVDKVTGKGLSTEDYTTVEKSKLAGIAVGAEVNVNADWNAVSGDAQILNKPTISGTNTGDQNLQQVTDEGETTTNNIQFIDSAEVVFGAGGGILLDNISRLREGTIDAGLGGSKGIAQICGVGYELKWEAGRLYVMNGNGNGIRESLYNFNIVPTVDDDNTKAYYQGSLWSLDNGDVYECLDATTGAAVWFLKSTGSTPTLQDVTDEGATTTNGITVTVGDGDGNGIYSTSSQGYGVYGSSNEAFGVYGNSPSSTGVYGDSNEGYGVQGNSASGVAIYGNSTSNNAIQGTSYTGTAVYANSDYGTGLVGISGEGIGVSAYSTTNIGLQVNGNGTIAIEANLGNSNKGLVINSGTSSTGNFIELAKNSVNKLTINQAGELTAQKLIKDGGTSSQILAADGSVITQGNNITITGGVISSVGGTGGGGSSVNYYLNGGTSQGTFGGTTYYEFSKTAVIGTGVDFNRNTNGYIASFITDVADPSLLLIPEGNWNLEFYFSSSSAGGSPSFYTELYKYDGTTFTLIASNSTSPEGITGGTTIDAYFTSLAVPETILTVNDRLAIRVFVNASSKTITLHTQDSHLCEVITTFTSGLTALNGLQAQVQNFATGTTGTDFAINSSGSTHTFNLPSANATARGVVTTSSQTFAGDKTFTGEIGASNLSGTNTGDNATNTQYSGLATSKQDKSLSAYKFIANNTNATANGTEQVYKDVVEQTLSNTGLVWTGTTAPGGTNSHTYKWSQIGKLVTLRVNLNYTVAGLSLSNVSIPFDNMSDLPIPATITGYTANGDVISSGSGALATTRGIPVFTSISMGMSIIRKNLAGTGTVPYDLCISRNANNNQYAYATIQYFTT